MVVSLPLNTVSPAAAVFDEQAIHPGLVAPAAARRATYCGIGLWPVRIWCNLFASYRPEAYSTLQSATPHLLPTAHLPISVDPTQPATYLLSNSLG